jgi:hypothetical protein
MRSPQNGSSPSKQGKYVMRFLTSIGTSGFFSLTLLASFTLAGCGGGKTTMVVPDPSATIGLPTPAAAGPVNTYSGAQSPGAWTLTLDNTKNIFSYQPTTYPATAATGSTQVTNGFTTLGTTGGYALEIQDRVAVLRPGGVATVPVFAVPQTECYPVTGRIRFQYLPTNADNTKTFAYGGISASTDSTGNSWQFGDLEGNGSLIAGPSSFTGTCGMSNGLSTISFTGQQSLLNDYWGQSGSKVTGPTANTQSNIWIGPSGFFVADQSDPTLGFQYGSSVAGVIEPSSVLTATDVASKKYLGFRYETLLTTSTPSTSPVGFGQVVASSGTIMTGGIFPSDDVTQTPNSDTMITLGKQDSTYNGLYPNASVTMLDPNQNCTAWSNLNSGYSLTVGVNADGYITCTFPAVAIVGNPESKYAIFLYAFDFTAGTYSSSGATRIGAPMQIYLFQQ